MSIDTVEGLGLLKDRCFNVNGQSVHFVHDIICNNRMTLYSLTLSTEQQYKVNQRNA